MRNDLDERTGLRRDRRRFLAQTGGALFCGIGAGVAQGAASDESTGGATASRVIRPQDTRPVRLFLCGDVMTGRGIDQILTHPGDPRLHEAFVKSARECVAIAEEGSGPIPRHVDPAYIWGDALAELDRLRPDARIVNLETAVTTADDAWPGKGIHYRMHPANVGCLSAARIDCCALANNHVLDWGFDGLAETLATLRSAGIRQAGAGADATEACAPAIIELPAGGRILVAAVGSPSAGIPSEWSAGPGRAGVCEMDESDPESVGRVLRALRELKRPGDLLVASIHWGSNWGYKVPGVQVGVAHRLIDEAGVDVVYGHSSHHPRPIEVHSGKLILYGCGDFLNDYEGIGGYEAYRPGVGFMYLPELDPASGRLRRLTLVPTRIRKFRVVRASAEEVEWLREMLEREGSAFGTRFRRNPDGNLELL